MEQMEFKVTNFEGPLDLLLHLVAEHKMDLFNIRILEVVDQYLAMVGTLTEEELDGASSFLEMAAKLVYLKSVALLPKREEEEELERELVGQLIEYGLCKRMAAKLEDIGRGIFLMARKPMEIELPPDYKLRHDPQVLLEAYLATGKKPVQRPAERDFDEIVAAPVVPVSTRIVYILRGLKQGTAKKISDLFRNVRSHSESIATFLGLLELMKVRRVLVDNSGGLTLVTKKHGHREENGNG